MTGRPPIAIIGDGGLCCVARAKKGRPRVARKTGWEDTTKRPDWIDVETMMRAMSALHSVSVGITLLPRGIGSTGGLSVGANCMFNVLPGSSTPPALSVIKDWPCSQHKDLVSHCFALLYELDWAIQKQYTQQEMF